MGFEINSNDGVAQQTIGKFKVKKVIDGCTSDGYLSRTYPIEVLNSLSNEEYLFIIDKLNKITRRHRKYSANLTISYCLFIILLTILLMVGTLLSNYNWILTCYLIISILSVILYIFILFKKFRKTNNELVSKVEQFNLIYSNRNTKFEIKKIPTNYLKVIFDLTIHYPCIQSPPQMYSTTDSIQSQQPQYTMILTPYTINDQQPTTIEKGLSYKINYNQNEKTSLLNILN